MSRLIGSRAAMAAACALASGSMGLALITQHVFDLQPCPWCVLQRLIVALIGLAGAVGWMWYSRSAVTWFSGLTIMLLCALGAAAALWQHFVAAASASCNLTFADRIISGLQLDALAPQVFAATASCADAKVNLLGVPYEFWSLALFVAIAGLLLFGLRRVD